MGIHRMLMGLIIGYAMAGAIVFTVVITCLSLVGWVKFAHPRQQNKLFLVLIVELVAVGVGFFSGFMKFNPVEASEQIETAAISKAETKQELDQAVAGATPRDMAKIVGVLKSVEPGVHVPADFQGAKARLLTHIRDARTISSIDRIEKTFDAKKFDFRAPM